MRPIPDRLIAALADRYRLERELGQGGMATVYLAHDLKHDRQVAVKVLKPELAAVLGAERFVVEIKTTASMTHPHILPLFDSGTADGFLFYVMPFIEGETLRSKLNRESQLGIDEAVRIAREVLDALEYAHMRGVIHRDIKPENILMQGGRPLITDFGIALAVSAAAGGRMTETGLSLGTPHYMSPEQATAEKEITGRADIYSLASVLYEMLTGEPPHMGNTAQQIIMKIITEPAAAVTKLRKSVPPHVAAAVAKALEKLPADRFETAKAFAEALGNPTFALAASRVAEPAMEKAATRRGSRVGLITAWVIALAALGAAAAGWMRKPPEEPFRRFDLAFGGQLPVPGNDVVISPDGRTLAVTLREGSGAVALYVRSLDADVGFRRLAGTDGAAHPSFSPDGEWLVFRRFTDRSIAKIPVGGGGVVTVLPAGPVDPFFPQWQHPDEIVFASPAGTYRVPAAGGQPELLPKVTATQVFPLPDRSGYLFAADGQVRLYDVALDSVFVVHPVGLSPTLTASGHLLYVSPEGGLFAVAYDAKRRQTTGVPARVLERVGGALFSRGYSVSRNGVLVQRDAVGLGALAENQLVIMTIGGAADTLRLPPARRTVARFSRDGRQLAMEVYVANRSGTNATDIFTLDLVTGTYTQMTFEGDNDEPAWSPDGKMLAFTVRGDTPGAEELVLKPADNSAPQRRITSLGAQDIGMGAWPSDTQIVFQANIRGRGFDLFAMRPDSGTAPVSYLQAPAAESEPRVSPDGRLVAYTSDEGGQLQIWLRDFPTPVGKWVVSRGTARAPRWSPDGRYIYYWRTSAPYDSLYRARVDRTPSIVVQTQEFVTALDVEGVQNWDIHPDGKRFIYTAPAAATGSGQNMETMHYFILQGWFGELRRVTGGRTP